MEWPTLLCSMTNSATSGLNEHSMEDIFEAVRGSLFFCFNGSHYFPIERSGFHDVSIFENAYSNLIERLLDSDFENILEWTSQEFHVKGPFTLSAFNRTSAESLFSPMLQKRERDDKKSRSSPSSAQTLISPKRPKFCEEDLHLYDFENEIANDILWEGTCCSTTKSSIPSCSKSLFSSPLKSMEASSFSTSSSSSCSISLVPSLSMATSTSSSVSLYPSAIETVDAFSFSTSSISSSIFPATVDIVEDNSFENLHSVPEVTMVNFTIPTKHVEDISTDSFDPIPVCRIETTQVHSLNSRTLAASAVSTQAQYLGSGDITQARYSDTTWTPWIIVTEEGKKRETDLAKWRFGHKQGGDGDRPTTYCCTAHVKCKHSMKCFPKGGGYFQLCLKGNHNTDIDRSKKKHGMHLNVRELVDVKILECRTPNEIILYLQCLTVDGSANGIKCFVNTQIPTAVQITNRGSTIRRVSNYRIETYDTIIAWCMANSFEQYSKNEQIEKSNRLMVLEYFGNIENIAITFTSSALTARLIEIVKAQPRGLSLAIDGTYKMMTNKYVLVVLSTHTITSVFDFDKSIGRDEKYGHSSQVLLYMIAKSESLDSMKLALTSLKVMFEKILKHETPQVVSMVMDHNEASKTATLSIFPRAKILDCYAHLMRNISKKRHLLTGKGKYFQLSLQTSENAIKPLLVQSSRFCAKLH